MGRRAWISRRLRSWPRRSPASATPKSEPGTDMSEPAVHVLVFDGFADWEPSYALAQIRQTGAAPVVSVGLSHHPVRSMGGLTVMPDVTVEQIAPEQVRLFILPGGDQWETAGLDARLVSLLEGCMANGAPLAAI